MNTEYFAARTVGLSAAIQNRIADAKDSITQDHRSSEAGIVLFKLADLIGAMRKDLGLSNKALGRNHRKLLRSSITDIDKF